MKSIIVGTAGHIDHGKSALVRALTGTDPDRLEEEKRRGITIDIGFASLDLGSEYRLGFIDVPGHERFVKNMLAGAGGIDLLLLVIAADRSIQPQTREHFDICRLLEIARGIVVITKADLVDQDTLGLVKLDVEEFVKGSFLEGAPMVAVNSRTGDGLDQLREVMRSAAAELPAKDSTRHFRLPIDRFFVMKGFGPVITGTLVAGGISKDAEVEAYPIGKKLRVRGIQVHGKSVSEAVAGQRTALNLTGAESGELVRGMTLAAPGRFVPTRRVDTRLQILRSASALKNGAQVHFHSGTAEIIATAVCLAAPREGKAEKRIEPGASAYVQLRLREPALLLPGDRFIIRKLSPVITIGGGQVLENWSPQHSIDKRAMGAKDVIGRLEIMEKGSREQILEQLLELAPECSLIVQDLVARTGWLAEECLEAIENLKALGRIAAVGGNPLRIAASVHLEKLAEAVMQALEQFHNANPLLPGAPLEAIRAKALPRSHPLLADTVLQQLVERQRIAISGETIRLAAHKVVLKPEEEEARKQIARSFEKAGLAVPAVKDVLAQLPIERRRAERILQILIKEAALIRVSEELVFHSESIRKLLRLLAQYKSSNSRISVSTFKDLTQVSRKYAIPLLEYLDREKITRRSGDERLLL